MPTTRSNESEKKQRGRAPCWQRPARRLASRSAGVIPALAVPFASTAYAAPSPPAGDGAAGPSSVTVRPYNPYIGRGKLARSNAEQVAKTRRILEELSLEVATPAEARAILHLKGGDRVGF